MKLNVYKLIEWLKRFLHSVDVMRYCMSFAGQWVAPYYNKPAHLIKFCYGQYYHYNTYEYYCGDRVDVGTGCDNRTTSFSSPKHSSLCRRCVEEYHRCAIKSLILSESMLHKII